MWYRACRWGHNWFLIKNGATNCGYPCRHRIVWIAKFKPERTNSAGTYKPVSQRISLCACIFPYLAIFQSHIEFLLWTVSVTKQDRTSSVQCTGQYRERVAVWMRWLWSAVHTNLPRCERVCKKGIKNNMNMNKSIARCWASQTSFELTLLDVEESAKHPNSMKVFSFFLFSSFPV